MDEFGKVMEREINRGGSRSYITGTEIVKKESDVIEKHKENRDETREKTPDMERIQG